MVSEILICPECRKQFEFNCTQLRSAADMLSCPHCGKGTAYRDFQVVFFCPNCRNISTHSPAEKINGQLRCPTCRTVAGTADGEEPAPEIQILPDNTIFDKYRIIKLLGKGGMSEVYQAEHLLLQRTYALKITKTPPGSTSSYKRFLREAQCFHQLRHKNIVRVYDIGCDLKSSRPFIAMEYITGKTLADEAGSFTPSELLNLARDMAKALVELHKNRIVHRDIKPSNIMRSANGSYLLMDLGIAKAENPDGNDFTLTVNQAIFGTPVYASAEQCQSPHTADHRSDIYSLGATLYHLASGKAPYNGKTPLETLVQVIQSDPQPLAKAAPHLPAPLVELIECMMNKSPELRPQDAGILLTMLNSIEEQLRHPIRRSWRLWKIAAAAVLVTAAVGIWAGKIYFHQQKKPPIRRKTPPLRRTAPAADRDNALQTGSPAVQTPSAVKTANGHICKAFRPARSAVVRFAEHNPVPSDLKKWKKPRQIGWQHHFTSAFKEAQKTGKKLLVFTYSGRFFPKFMQQNPARDFLHNNFVLLFLDCDMDNMTPQQLEHIRQVRALLGTASYWPSTTVLKSSGSWAGNIPAFINHKQGIYEHLLNELLQEREVHFDFHNNYIAPNRQLGD